MRWVNRGSARWIAASAYAFGLSPNAITLMSACLSLTGVALLILLPPTVMLGVAVALLLALGFVFDSADGQLARLYRRPSKAGEWLDHVVDAFRSPAIHVGAAIGVARFFEEMNWLALVALWYGLVTSAQFLSQILAEALVNNAGSEIRRGGTLRSFVLLPIDPGVLLWSFVLWGTGAPFAVVYCMLAFVATVHSFVSMRRRHRDLSALDAARSA
ncbi:CDP-alcohol phosphatidyltransferase family protein [Tessaracoccus sp.]|uniref:CDP-alcohol phosphatidyltransferase family protein n=1 Tax=Tessaracoccus sp. TaxID=1971211 RepID=UPI002632ED5F|nr:CDP-alcohol phosphatidyltransferase family protein [Tessaracoccus sp.]